MFKKIKQKRELKELNGYFQEANALLVYILITCTENNLEYFEDRFTLREKVTELLNGGLGFSEAGNERAAFIHFREAIAYICSEHRVLIEQDVDLMEGLQRAMDLEEDKIKPLWLSYQEKYLD